MSLGAVGTVAVILGEAGDEAEAERAARMAGAIQVAQVETGAALPSVTVLHMPQPGDVAGRGLVRSAPRPSWRKGAKLSIEEAIELALVESGPAPRGAGGRRVGAC